MNYVSLFFDFKKYIVMFPHDTFDPVINSVFIHKCFLRTYKVLGIVLSDRNISVSKKHPTLWFSYLMMISPNHLYQLFEFMSFPLLYFILFWHVEINFASQCSGLSFSFFFYWSNAWKLHLICQWATYFTAYGGYVMCLIWANLHIFLIKLHISLLTFALFQR